jgi:hypothetical protein
MSPILSVDADLQRQKAASIQFTLSLLCIFSIVARVFGSAELYLWLGVGLGTFGIAMWFLYWGGVAVDLMNADSRGLTGGLFVLANTAFVVGLACRFLGQPAGHLWRQRVGTG